MKSNYDLNDALWVDTSTLIGVSILPDRLPDVPSIEYCSLVNLFNCPIGARGPIFEPTYGTLLYQHLQEPIDEITAASIRINLIQAIERWEPRIDLIHNLTSVVPDYDIPGYRVRVGYIVRLTGASSSATFTLTKDDSHAAG